jgi:hypothetical protein
MRYRRVLIIVMIVSLLGGCTSLIFGNRLQSAVLGALFESVLGFNPNDVKLLENPAVKSRMQSMLGSKYEPTVALLREAQKIQRDGAAYYLLAKAAPTITNTIAKQTGMSQEQTNAALALANNAGLSWDSNLNKFSVLLVQDGVPQLFSEPTATEGDAASEPSQEPVSPSIAAALVPSLPKEMQAVYSQAKALDDKRKQLTDPKYLIEQGINKALPAQ